MTRAATGIAAGLFIDACSLWTTNDKDQHSGTRFWYWLVFC
jgi:hypothetical protein